MDICLPVKEEAVFDGGGVAKGFVKGMQPRQAFLALNGCGLSAFPT